MKKIKILMILGVSGGGGAETMAMDIFRNIDKSLFEIDFAFCYFFENGYQEEIKLLGGKVHLIPHFNIFNYFTFIAFWKNFFKTHPYDIVHAHTFSSCFALKEAQKIGCKTIIHSHNTKIQEPNIFYQFAKKLFRHYIKRYSDYWFSCSEDAAKFLYGTKYSTNPNYYTIPNSIETSLFLFNEIKRNKIRNSLNITKDTLVIGNVGRFSYQKNHHFLIDIFKILHKKNNNSKLLLCGDGMLMPKIKKYAQTQGVYEYCLFVGCVPNVNEYLMAMDVMIFPSHFEGLPVTIIEAQATGLPIILSNVISKEVDIIDLIKRISLKENAEIWANAALSMYSLSINKQKYNEIIAASKYNIYNSIKDLEKIYRSMI